MKIKNYYRMRYQRSGFRPFHPLTNLSSHVLTSRLSQPRNSKWDSFLGTLIPQANPFCKIVKYFTNLYRSEGHCLHPKIYPFRSSSGCHNIDYIIKSNQEYIIPPLSSWHAVPSSHTTRLIRGWHCPSIQVLATRYCIPQTQYCNNDLIQILHYVKTLIKQPQNWNRIIFQTPSSTPEP
jgi:hypothetical protein